MPEDNKVKPVIAISGPSGSGKTTYAKMLARDLGLEYYSAGMAFRELARKMGVDLVELNREAARNPSIDLSIDREVYRKALQRGIVLEGHLVAWIVRDVADVAIYVTARLEERIKRIIEREKRRQNDVIIETLLREELQWKRFLEYYGIDTTQLGIFDLVLDTTSLTIEDAYHVILTYTCLSLKHKYGSSQQLICPKREQLYSNLNF